MIFNLLAAGEAALGAAILVGLTALGVPLAWAAVSGCVAVAVFDGAVRWRAGRRPMDPTAGGMVMLLPMWICALLGLMAVALIVLMLPEDWDRRRADPDASVAAPPR